MVAENHSQIAESPSPTYYLHRIKLIARFSVKRRSLEPQDVRRTYYVYWCKYIFIYVSQIFICTRNDATRFLI